MRRIYQLSKNKKALSNVVGYVVLIGITVALSVMVYNWLRFYVSEDEIPECDDGVNVIITEYFCSPGNSLELTLKNKGRFTVDNYTLRIHDRDNAEFGVYELGWAKDPILPGAELKITESLVGVKISASETKTFDKVTLIEVQPFMMEDNGEDISCKSVAMQKINC